MKYIYRIIEKDDFENEKVIKVFKRHDKAINFINELIGDHVVTITRHDNETHYQMYPHDYENGFKLYIIRKN